jgi:hypothetical protein
MGLKQMTFFQFFCWVHGKQGNLLVLTRMLGDLDCSSRLFLQSCLFSVGGAEGVGSNFGTEEFIFKELLEIRLPVFSEAPVLALSISSNKVQMEEMG